MDERYVVVHGAVATFAVAGRGPQRDRRKSMLGRRLRSSEVWTGAPIGGSCACLTGRMLGDGRREAVGGPVVEGWATAADVLHPAKQV